MATSKNLKAYVPNPTENKSIPPKRNAINKSEINSVKILPLYKDTHKSQYHRTEK